MNSIETGIAVLTLFFSGIAMGAIGGQHAERKEIAKLCERVGSVLINDKVIECKVKQ